MSLFFVAVVRLKLGAFELSAPAISGGDQIENLAVGDFYNAARDKPAVQI